MRYQRLVPSVVLAVLVGCQPCACRKVTIEGASSQRTVGVKAFDMGTPDVVLLITGGADGVMEPCNCGGVMSGGLARRTGLVRSYRSAFDNVFLMDTGNALRMVRPGDPRNRYVLKGYQQVGYDALALAAHEWHVPTDEASKLFMLDGITFLSTTLRPKGRTRHLMARDITRQLGEVKLAVLSDVPLDALQLVHPGRLGEISDSSPEALAGRIAALKEAGHVVVLATHSDDAQMARMVKSCDADLLVRGRTVLQQTVIDHVAGTPVFNAAGFGYVGVVALKVEDGEIAALEYRLEAVDDRWPRELMLVRTYQEYMSAAAEYILGNVANQQGLAYVPSSKCGSCHEPQYKTWRSTRHAKAYQTLTDASREHDPDCLMCHTSGFGTTEGFSSFDKTPALANVNCQDCHRFNIADHQDAAFSVPRLDKRACMRCHTKTTDPRFDYKTRLAGVRCSHSAKK